METERELLMSRVVMDRVADQMLTESRREISEGIDAQVDSGSNVIVLTVDRPTAEEAADLANQIAQAYLARREEAQESRIEALPEPETDEEERVLLETRYLTRLSRAEIISPAVAPLEAHSPRPVRAVAAGAVAGLVLGLGSSLVAGAATRRVRSRADISKSLPEAEVWSTIRRPELSHETDWALPLAAIAHSWHRMREPHVLLVPASSKVDVGAVANSLAEGIRTMGRVEVTDEAGALVDFAPQGTDRHQGEAPEADNTPSPADGTNSCVLSLSPSPGHSSTIGQAGKADITLLIMRNGRTTREELLSADRLIRRAGGEVSGIIVTGAKYRRHWSA